MCVCMCACVCVHVCVRVCVCAYATCPTHLENLDKASLLVGLDLQNELLVFNVKIPTGQLLRLCSVAMEMEPSTTSVHKRYPRRPGHTHKKAPTPPQPIFAQTWLNTGSVHKKSVSCSACVAGMSHSNSPARRSLTGEVSWRWPAALVLPRRAALLSARHRHTFSPSHLQGADTHRRAAITTTPACTCPRMQRAVQVSANLGNIGGAILIVTCCTALAVSFPDSTTHPGNETIERERQTKL